MLILFFTEKDYYEHLERLGVKDREKKCINFKVIETKKNDKKTKR